MESMASFAQHVHQGQGPQVSGSPHNGDCVHMLQPHPRFNMKATPCSHCHAPIGRMDTCLKCAHCRNKYHQQCWRSLPAAHLLDTHGRAVASTMSPAASPGTHPSPAPVSSLSAATMVTHGARPTYATAAASPRVQQPPAVAMRLAASPAMASSHSLSPATAVSSGALTSASSMRSITRVACSHFLELHPRLSMGTAHCRVCKKSIGRMSKCLRCRLCKVKVHQHCWQGLPNAVVATDGGMLMSSEHNDGREDASFGGSPQPLGIMPGTENQWHQQRATHPAGRGSGSATGAATGTWVTSPPRGQAMSPEQEQVVVVGDDLDVLDSILSDHTTLPPHLRGRHSSPLHRQGRKTPAGPADHDLLPHQRKARGASGAGRRPRRHNSDLSSQRPSTNRRRSMRERAGQLPAKTTQQARTRRLLRQAQRQKEAQREQAELREQRTRQLERAQAERRRQREGLSPQPQTAPATQAASQPQSQPQSRSRPQPQLQVQVQSQWQSPQHVQSPGQWQLQQQMQQRSQSQHSMVAAPWTPPVSSPQAAAPTTVKAVAAAKRVDAGECMHVLQPHPRLKLSTTPCCHCDEAIGRTDTCLKCVVCRKKYHQRCWRELPTAVLQDTEGRQVGMVASPAAPPKANAVLLPFGSPLFPAHMSPAAAHAASLRSLKGGADAPDQATCSHYLQQHPRFALGSAPCKVCHKAIGRMDECLRCRTCKAKVHHQCWQGLRDAAVETEGGVLVAPESKYVASAHVTPLDPSKPPAMFTSLTAPTKDDVAVHPSSPLVSNPAPASPGYGLYLQPPPPPAFGRQADGECVHVLQPHARLKLGTAPCDLCGRPIGRTGTCLKCGVCRCKYHHQCWRGLRAAFLQDADGNVVDSVRQQRPAAGVASPSPALARPAFAFPPTGYPHGAQQVSSPAGTPAKASAMARGAAPVGGGAASTGQGQPLCAHFLMLHPRLALSKAKCSVCDGSIGRMEDCLRCTQCLVKVHQRCWQGLPGASVITQAGVVSTAAAAAPGPPLSPHPAAAHSHTASMDEAKQAPDRGAEGQPPTLADPRAVAMEEISKAKGTKARCRHVLSMHQRMAARKAACAVCSDRIGRMEDCLRCGMCQLKVHLQCWHSLPEALLMSEHGMTQSSARYVDTGEAEQLQVRPGQSATVPAAPPAAPTITSAGMDAATARQQAALSPQRAPPPAPTPTPTPAPAASPASMQVPVPKPDAAASPLSADDWGSAASTAGIMRGYIRVEGTVYDVMVRFTGSFHEVTGVAVYRRVRESDEPAAAGATSSARVAVVEDTGASGMDALMVAAATSQCRDGTELVMDAFSGEYAEDVQVMAIRTTSSSVSGGRLFGSLCQGEFCTRRSLSIVFVEPSWQSGTLHVVERRPSLHMTRTPTGAPRGEVLQQLLDGEAGQQHGGSDDRVTMAHFVLPQSTAGVMQGCVRVGGTPYHFCVRLEGMLDSIKATCVFEAASNTDSAADSAKSSASVSVTRDHGVFDAAVDAAKQSSSLHGRAMVCDDAVGRYDVATHSLKLRTVSSTLRGGACIGSLAGRTFCRSRRVLVQFTDERWRAGVLRVVETAVPSRGGASAGAGGGAGAGGRV